MAYLREYYTHNIDIIIVAIDKKSIYLWQYERMNRASNSNLTIVIIYEHISNTIQ